MIRELTLTAMATLMLASTAFGAVDKPETKDAAKDDAKKDAVQVDAKVEAGKAANYQMRIFREASFIVGEANKASASGQCDAMCVRTAQALEKVAREKQNLGLSDTIKPEKTVHEIYKKMVSEHKTLAQAEKEAIDENGVKQKELLDCAGK